LRENSTELIHERMKHVSQKLSLQNKSTASISDELIGIAHLLNEHIDLIRTSDPESEYVSADDYEEIDEIRTILNAIDDIEIALSEGDSHYQLQIRINDEIDALEKVTKLSR
jgi:hypothetical protein